ncbi:MAG: hypothetical protein M3Y03_03255 [Verrucomicrobiota bacterium]|nr:hypothetical protein [Verrucomicrobiota bacterium]
MRIPVLALAMASSISLVAAAQSSLPDIEDEKIRVESRISASGGTIAYAVADPGDEVVRAKLVGYGETVAGLLRKGDHRGLTALFAKQPSLQRLLKIDGVSCSVSNQTNGFVVSFGAANQSSRTAIHEFIHAFQPQGLLTPEERAANRPGNNLGWDAHKDPNLGK